jgi:hypothetical protein
MSLTGIYGAPLEFLKARLLASAAFATFSAAKTIALTDKSAAGLVVGDAWAVLSYKEGGHRISLTPGLTFTRTPRIALVKAVAKVTEAAKEAMVNSAGAIVADFLADSACVGVVSDIELETFGSDDEITPCRVGCIVRVRMDL